MSLPRIACVSGKQGSGKQFRDGITIWHAGVPKPRRYAVQPDRVAVVPASGHDIMRTTTRLNGMLAWMVAVTTASAAELSVRVADDHGKAVADAVVTVLPQGASVNGLRRGRIGTKTIDQKNRSFIPYIEIFRPATRSCSATATRPGTTCIRSRRSNPSNSSSYPARVRRRWCWTRAA